MGAWGLLWEQSWVQSPLWGPGAAAARRRDGLAAEPCAGSLGLTRTVTGLTRTGLTRTVTGLTRADSDRTDSDRDRADSDRDRADSDRDRADSDRPG
jgi:hypothetical protein